MLVWCLHSPYITVLTSPITRPKKAILTSGTVADSMDSKLRVLVEHINQPRSFQIDVPSEVDIIFHTVLRSIYVIFQIFAL